MDTNIKSCIRIIYDKYKNYFDDGKITFCGSVLYTSLGIINDQINDIDLLIDDSSYDEIILLSKDFNLLDSKWVDRTKFFFIDNIKIDIFKYDLFKYESDRYIINLFDDVNIYFYGYNELLNSKIQTINDIKNTIMVNSIIKNNTHIIKSFKIINYINDNCKEQLNNQSLVLINNFLNDNILIYNKK